MIDGSMNNASLLTIQELVISLDYSTIDIIL